MVVAHWLIVFLMRNAQLGLFWFCVASKIKITNNNPPCFWKVCAVLLLMLMGGAVVAHWLIVFFSCATCSWGFFGSALLSKIKITNNNPPCFRKVCAAASLTSCLDGKAHVDGRCCVWHSTSHHIWKACAASSSMTPPVAAIRCWLLPSQRFIFFSFWKQCEKIETIMTWQTHGS